jgi:hypothetical protein
VVTFDYAPVETADAKGPTIESDAVGVESRLAVNPACGVQEHVTEGERRQRYAD